MTAYLVGLTSTQRPDVRFCRKIYAPSPRAAALAAQRALRMARRWGFQQVPWDGWYVGMSSGLSGKFLIYQQGEAN